MVRTPDEPRGEGASRSGRWGERPAGTARRTEGPLADEPMAEGGRIEGLPAVLESAEAEQEGLERMWPLDISLAVLGGLVIYTIATRLPADDPRLLYNPWTYAAAVPLVVVGLSLLLRNLASRFVRRSLQLGFLMSVMVHVLMLIAFFNVIIFAPFWPSTTTGDQPIRAPLRKTVPDYLFTRSELPQRQPDWSRPVDASTSSRTLPEQQRTLLPLEAAEANLELAVDPPPETAPDQPSLTPRQHTDTAMPAPSSSAAELSRQMRREVPSVDSVIAVPDVPVPASQSSGSIERALEAARAASAGARLSDSGLASASPVEMAPFAAPEVVRQDRQRPADLPQVTQRSVAAVPERRLDLPSPTVPAGASPAAPSVAVARETIDAHQMLSQRSVPLPAPGDTQGAALEPATEAVDPATAAVSNRPLEAALERSEVAIAGMPNVAAPSPGITAPPSREARSGRSLEVPEGLLAAPDLSEVRVADASGDTGEGADVAAALERFERPLDATRSQNAEDRGAMLAMDALRSGAPSAAEMPLNVPLGPSGLSIDPAPRVGSPLAERMPEVAAIDFAPPTQRTWNRGGRPAVAGAEITGMRPFDRRAMRTSGGAAPTPAGMVGPEVERSIEIGLAYLAERQNPDGSWSLQGHGESTSMRSDTAATGLCLLAFQGAGYTHQQHQYADTVARGLEFLVRNQGADGDLYRPEDQVSDRNAWLYSHGIAALALCEAYGMTRDPELREPAQRSVDFIVDSQDPIAGGWRYQPRLGSDTSVTGWMMMALKSGELSGLTVPAEAYAGIGRWMDLAQEAPDAAARYRYNPHAPLTVTQAHGRQVTPSMTAVGLLARMYLGWERGLPEMQRGADYLGESPPSHGTAREPKRDTYYWYYATQVMFHMGGEHWRQWNERLSPLLVGSQLTEGANAGSWDPHTPIPDRWAPHAGRLYVTAMNLLSLEVYYRHLPIYEQVGK